jgi:hypothetical protein
MTRMPLDVVPDNRGLRHILAAQITGPYRFVHHALIPYVRVGPATRDAPITIRGGDELTLMTGATKELRGLENTVDFAVMFEGADVVLREVPYRSAALNSLAFTPMTVSPRPVAPVGEGTRREQPDGGERVREPTPAPVVAPTPAAPDFSIPAHLKELCAREDIQPDQGDYLVIPEAQMSQYGPLPVWVASSPHIVQVRVVKPRDRVDRPVES